MSVGEHSGGLNLLSTLNIPYVAVRTPSDESNRSSSHNSSPSRPLSSNNSRQQRSLSNTRMSVRETVKSFFRSSKTVDNMASGTNGHHHLTNHSSDDRRHGSKSKISSMLINNQLSHSQPIVTNLSINENGSFDSAFIGHSEQTPLLDRRNDLKQMIDPSKISFDDPPETNPKEIRLNRQGLHLPLDIDGLHRSRSCTDAIVLPTANGETTNSTVMTNLHPNHSEVASLRSSDSNASSLSAFLPTQTAVTTQLSAPSNTTSNGKTEMSKSQESLFSCSSPVQKQPSFKSLLMAASTKDPTTKQGNDVLVLIASWVLRSPEDFQGEFLKYSSFKS